MSWNDDIAALCAGDSRINSILKSPYGGMPYWYTAPDWALRLALLTTLPLLTCNRLLAIPPFARFTDLTTSGVLSDPGLQ